MAVFLEATLRAGIPYWWRPRGFSMRPAIDDGDRVLVAPVDPADVRPGDIVKFRFEGGFLLHRCVRKNPAPSGDLFAFRGDNSTETETGIGVRDIIGRAIAVERGGLVTPLRGTGPLGQQGKRIVRFFTFDG